MINGLFGLVFLYENKLDRGTNCISYLHRNKLPIRILIPFRMLEKDVIDSFVQARLFDIKNNRFMPKSLFDLRCLVDQTK